MKFKPDWFLLGMVLATVLAWVFPEPGASGGWMHPELITKAGVALIFFLHGLVLSFHALRAGALNWRLHLVVQACTFFPCWGCCSTSRSGDGLPSKWRSGSFSSAHCPRRSRPRWR
jgi:sodium/bile acid cotransporter 7